MLETVGGQKEMSPMVQKIVLPARGLPTQTRTEEAATGLNIFVLFTSVGATLAALKHAGELAASLGARITLLAAQVVPYPLPLDSPPVLVELNEHRFRVIASQSPLETQVHIYLCRDWVATLTSILNPGSLILLGGRKRRWWPTQDQALARTLRRAGHEVIFKKTE